MRHHRHQRDSLPHPLAKQFVDGHAARFAVHIPERKVYRGMRGAVAGERPFHYPVQTLNLC